MMGWGPAILFPGASQLILKMASGNSGSPGAAVEAEGHAKYHEQTHEVPPSGLHISQRTNWQLYGPLLHTKVTLTDQTRGQKGWE